MKRTQAIATIMAALLGLATTASGQYYVGQDGHLLDANPRVGSMGINPEARLDALVPRVNMYITGNVTRGAAFQGAVPYQSQWEFRGTLGSSTLSNFRRDATSLNAARARALAPQAYVDPSRSVTTYYGRQIVDTGQLFQGTPTVATVREAAGLGAGVSVRPNGTLDMRIRRQEIVGGELFPYYTPAVPGEGLYGMRRFVPFELREGEAAGQFEPEDRMLLDDPYATDEVQQEGTIMRSERRSLRGPEAETDREQEPGERRREPGFVPGETPRDSQELPRTRQEEQAVEEQPEGGLGVTGEQGRQLGASAQEQAQARYREHMMRGTELLAQGDFYRAADAFTSATVYRLNDARALLGRAHALFGAGEFMSASFLLSRALELEPALAAEPVDPQAWFQSPEQFEDRLGDLEEWSGQTGRWELKLLRAYIIGHSGDPAGAQQLLAQVLAEQPELSAAQLLREAFASGKGGA